MRVETPGRVWLDAAQRRGQGWSSVEEDPDVAPPTPPGPTRQAALPRHATSRLDLSPPSDTTMPHWLGSTRTEPAEIVIMFGRPGERMTLRETPAQA